MDFPKFLAGAFKAMLIMLVLTFLGIHSYNFFSITFSDKYQYFSWLGFGLTSIAMVGYLVIFLAGSGSDVQNGIAYIMMWISLIGEVVTAGFGMQIEAMGTVDIVFSKQEFQYMVYFVQALGFAHGVALILYFTYDKASGLFTMPTKSKGANKNKPANKPSKPLANSSGKMQTKN